jgi:hypothetical protein
MLHAGMLTWSVSFQPRGRAGHDQAAPAPNRDSTRRKSSLGVRPSSLDDLVRPREHGRRDREAEGLILLRTVS